LWHCHLFFTYGRYIPCYDPWVMQTIHQEALETPRESEQVFVPSTTALSGTGTQVTWVAELIGYTVNGCFKIRDQSGKVRIVKRHRSKDLADMKAWISLN